MRGAVAFLIRAIRGRRWLTYQTPESRPSCGIKKGRERAAFLVRPAAISSFPSFSSSVRKPCARRNTRTARIRCRRVSGRRSWRRPPGWAAATRRGRGGGPSVRRNVFVLDVAAFSGSWLRHKNGRKFPACARIITPCPETGQGRNHRPPDGGCPPDLLSTRPVPSSGGKPITRIRRDTGIRVSRRRRRRGWSRCYDKMKILCGVTPNRMERLCPREASLNFSSTPCGMRFPSDRLRQAGRPIRSF
jgi:hypothetical protein